MGGADHNLFSVEMLFWVQMERQGYDIVQVSHKFTSRHYSSIACSLEAHYVLPAMLKGISSCIYLVYMHVVLSSKGQCIFFLLFFSFSFFFKFYGKECVGIVNDKVDLRSSSLKKPRHCWCEISPWVGSGEQARLLFLSDWQIPSKHVWMNEIN